MAAVAGVDPSMVMRYCGNKDGLLRACVDVDLRLPDLTGERAERPGEVLAWHLVTCWKGHAMVELPG